MSTEDLATSDQLEVQPTSSNPPTPEDMLRGWRVFRSDRGRLWACREQPFSRAAEFAGAARTVEADDKPELCARVAAQEALAKVAPLL